MMAKIQRIALMGILVEWVVLFALSFGIWLFIPDSGVSFLLGGCIFAIPTTYFAVYAFRYSGAQWTPLVVRSFYRGQAGKLTLIGLGFALVFHFRQGLNHLDIFLGFITLILIHLLIATWVSNRISDSR